MALPIYDLAPAYASLADLPLESDSTEPDSSGRLEESLRAIEEDTGSKLLALAKVVRTLEEEADLLEGHARDLIGKAAVRRRRVEWLKRWMQLHMEADGVSKLKDAFVTVWLQALSGAIEVVDEALVPPEYKRVTLRLPLSLVPLGLLGHVQTCDVDRAGIHAHLKATGELPAGIVYRQGQRHLRIR